MKGLSAKLAECKEEPKKLRTIEDGFKEEVESLQRGLGKAAEEEEEEEQEMQGGARKRKRGAGASSSLGAKQAKTDVGAVFVEGLEWQYGTNFRKRDELRGQVMIEAAADAGVACAEAYCICRGLGGRQENKDEAFKRFEQLAEGGGEHQAIAMYNIGFCYNFGKGAAKDEAKAVEWYTKAAEAGNSSAMGSLGVFHKHGVVDRLVRAVSVLSVLESAGLRAMNAAANPVALAAGFASGNGFRAMNAAAKSDKSPRCP